MKKPFQVGDRVAVYCANARSEEKEMTHEEMINKADGGMTREEVEQLRKERDEARAKLEIAREALEKALRFIEPFAQIKAGGK